MSARGSRAGFFAYAGVLAAEVALDHAHRLVSGLSTYLYPGLAVASVVALVAISGAPNAARSARPARAAALLAGLLGVVLVGEELFLRSSLSEHFLEGGVESVRRFFEIVGAVVLLLDSMVTGLLLLVVVRIGRVVASRGVGPGALAALVATAAHALLWATSLTGFGEGAEHAGLFLAETLARDASAVSLAALCAYAGALVTRLPATDGGTAPGGAESETLSPAWGAPASGISLYLGAAAARATCSLLSILVMSTAQGATSFHDLEGVRQGLLFVAALSAVATLSMLAGVWRISRVPPASRGAAPARAALVLIALGFVLDLVTTSITSSALGGDVSAAFDLEHAFPVLGFFSIAVGIGAGVALLRSFRNMASCLGVAELVQRAEGATLLLGVTGAIAALVVLGLNHVPSELLLVLAVVLLPLAIALLVQFLRVAVPLGREIRVRLRMST